MIGSSGQFVSALMSLMREFAAINVGLKILMVVQYGAGHIWDKGDLLALTMICQAAGHFLVVCLICFGFVFALNIVICKVGPFTGPVTCPEPGRPGVGVAIPGAVLR